MLTAACHKGLPLPDGWLDELCRDGYYACNRGPLLDLDLFLVAWELKRLGEDLVPGEIVDLKCLPDSPHTTLTQSQVPFHNDGGYRPGPPRYLLLYCLKPGSRGGETLFARGDAVAARLDTRTRALLARRTFRTKIDRYAASRRLVLKHPRDGTAVLFYGNPALSTDLSLSAARGVPLRQIQESLQVVFSDPEIVCYRHRWRRHDLLIFDNYTLLHARTAYQGHRLLKRMEINPA